MVLVYDNSLYSLSSYSVCSEAIMGIAGFVAIGLAIGIIAFILIMQGVG